LNLNYPKLLFVKGKNCVPQSFVLVKNITNQIILGVPFINNIFPLIYWDSSKIIGNWNNKPFILVFVTKPFTRMINDLTEKLISKNNQVNFIKQEINSIEVDHILQNPKLQENIAILSNQFSLDICGDHPNAFWSRKKHVAFHMRKTLIRIIFRPRQGLVR